MSYLDFIPLDTDVGSRTLFGSQNLEWKGERAGKAKFESANPSTTRGNDPNPT